MSEFRQRDRTRVLKLVRSEVVEEMRQTGQVISEERKKQMVDNLIAWYKAIGVRIPETLQGECLEVIWRAEQNLAAADMMPSAILGSPSPRKKKYVRREYREAVGGPERYQQVELRAVHQVLNRRNAVRMEVRITTADKGIQDFGLAGHPVICKFCGAEFRVEADRYLTATYCHMPHKIMGDWLDRRPSCLEVVGYAMLEDLGVTFYAQYHLIRNLVVDAYLPDYRLVIQFDGHQHKQPQRAAADLRHDKFLREAGFEVCRLTKQQLLQEPGKCRQGIVNAMTAASA